ncbi:MAG: hypothetical protein HY904_25845 [Deltaproteobacteria bacterium]|nr:hypothetical protein [Deltaproteobacteria bacterium]
MTLERAHLERLCRIPPEQFTAERDALVRELKSAGRKEDAAEVKALRRPSTALYAVNQAARQTPEQVQALLSLTQRVLTAQRAGAPAAEVLEATRQQRAVLQSLVDAARAFAPDADDRVRAILSAAATSPAATEQLRAGVMLQEPTAADLSELLQAPAPPPGVAHIGQLRREQDERAERERAAEEQRRAARAKRLAELEQEVARAEAEARAAHTHAEETAAEARKARETAERTARVLEGLRSLRNDLLNEK